MILVDFSNLAHVCFWPANSAVESDPKYVLRDVFSDNLRAKINDIAKFTNSSPKDWVFVKDGHAKFRRDLCPGYKQNRDKDRFDPKPMGEDLIRELFPLASWVHEADKEADDTIAEIVIGMESPVTIITGDKDMWQLMQYPHVEVLDPIKIEFVTVQRIEKSFHFSDPKFIALHKALWGDSSDNIPNACPRMQKYLLPIITASDGTLEDFTRLLNSGVFSLSPRCKELLDQGWQQIQINDKIVRLGSK